MLQKNMQKKDIAAAIGVSPSTITRELKRNSGKHGRYDWKTAQSNATYRKRRQPGNHAIKDEVKKKVVSLLVADQWSPRQISGRLTLEGKNISHETIYKMIRADKADGGDLYKNCRHRLKHRRRPVGEARIKIPWATQVSMTGQKMLTTRDSATWKWTPL